MEQTLPLKNISIVVTRPAHQNRAICQQLNELGANTIAFPCIEILPNPSIDPTLMQQQVAQCQGLIFISTNAVNQAFALIPSLKKSINSDCLIYAVGSATANALNQCGIEQIQTPNNALDSEELLKIPALQEVKQKMMLIIKGVGGRELIYDTLRARGAQVHNIEIYLRRLPKLVDITPLNNKIDLILFTSSETVNNFLALTSDSLQESLLTCQTVVGHPRIAEKVTALGFKKLPIIAATPSDTDMLVAIKRWVRQL